MPMGNTFVDKLEVVLFFLQELKQVLCSDVFSYENDLDILERKKTDIHYPGFTTIETMAALDYGKKDVYDELISLTEKDYFNTVIDDKDSNAPNFFAFGKTIQARPVYIKVKIRDKVNGKVFCVSFHFAREPMTMPYKK
jgi:hypothetical protein